MFIVLLHLQSKEFGSITSSTDSYILSTFQYYISFINIESLNWNSVFLPHYVILGSDIQGVSKRFKRRLILNLIEISGQYKM